MCLSRLKKLSFSRPGRRYWYLYKCRLAFDFRYVLLIGKGGQWTSCGQNLPRSRPLNDFRVVLFYRRKLSTYFFIYFLTHSVFHLFGDRVLTREVKVIRWTGHDGRCAAAVPVGAKVAAKNTPLWSALRSVGVNSSDSHCPRARGGGWRRGSKNGHCRHFYKWHQHLRGTVDYRLDVPPSRSVGSTQCSCARRQFCSHQTVHSPR